MSGSTLFGGILQPFLGGKITQPYGKTNNSAEPSLFGFLHFHTGVDYATNSGTPIYAFGQGVVSKAGWDTTGYGNTVVVNQNNGFDTLFGHLSKFAVTPGETVKAGQLLGYSGSSGNSTGPHVHFTVTNSNGQLLNPITGFLAKAGALSPDSTNKFQKTPDVQVPVGTSGIAAEQQDQAQAQAQAQGQSGFPRIDTPWFSVCFDWTRILLIFLALVLMIVGFVRASGGTPLKVAALAVPGDAEAATAAKAAESV